MSVEFDPLWSHRGGEMKASSRFQHPGEISQTFVKTFKIDRVPVTTESEMFDGMQAGERVGAFQKVLVQTHQIGLMECHVVDVRGHGTDIEYFDWTKHRNVSHEAIDSRADVHVPDRF